MTFTLETHPKLRKFFKPRPEPPPRPTFKLKSLPNVPSFPCRTLREILMPPRLDIHIQARECAESLGPRFYSDIVDDFMQNAPWTENILAVGYEQTLEDPVGKHGLDILSDLFELLNGRLDAFGKIYIDVPEASMETISSGNILGLEESSWLEWPIKLDNALNLRTFRWSGNFDLLKNKFQVSFSRLTSLSLLHCRIDVDEASLLLAQCHDLYALEIGTLIRTDTSDCKMPRTWWRHFQLRFTLLESLTIISECLLLEFTSRLALTNRMCGSNLKKLSLTFLTQNASRRISELDFPWSRLTTVDIDFQVGVIPSENSLHSDLIHKSKLAKSALLRINGFKIKRESQFDVVRENFYAVPVVEDASNLQDEGDNSMSELDELDFSTDGEQVSLLTLPG